MVDNIETWNEYFNSGNRAALDLDILQLLSKQRYRHLDDAGNGVEQRLNESKIEAKFWIFDGAVGSKRARIYHWSGKIYDPDDQKRSVKRRLYNKIENALLQGFQRPLDGQKRRGD